MRYPPQPIPLLTKIEPKDYWGQPKFDGWRVVRENGIFYTRHGNKLPQDILNSLLTNNSDYDLDLELVSTEGRTRIPTVLSGNDSDTGRLILLDVMIPDMPIEERHELVKTIAKQENIAYAPLFPAKSWDEINHHLKKAFEREYGHICDGIVLKKQDSHYPISELGPICFQQWIKIKNFYQG